MRPALNEALQYKDYDIIPLSEEILSDVKTPIEVLKNLKAVSKCHYLLESVSDGKISRYSFLGFNPILKLKCKNNVVTIENNDLKT